MAFKLFADFGTGIFELADALAQAPRQLGDFVGPEKNQDDDHNQHDFAAAEVAQK